MKNNKQNKVPKSISQVPKIEHNEEPKIMENEQDDDLFGVTIQRNRNFKSKKNLRNYY